MRVMLVAVSHLCVVCVFRVCAMFSRVQPTGYGLGGVALTRCSGMFSNKSCSGHHIDFRDKTEIPQPLLLIHTWQQSVFTIHRLYATRRLITTTLV